MHARARARVRAYVCTEVQRRGLYRNYPFLLVPLSLIITRYPFHFIITLFRDCTLVTQFIKLANSLRKLKREDSASRRR